MQQSSIATLVSARLFVYSTAPHTFTESIRILSVNRIRYIWLRFPFLGQQEYEEIHVIISRFTMARSLLNVCCIEVVVEHEMG